MSIMNPFEKIPENEIQFFKEKVQRWLHVDSQITQLESQIRELKKVRNKELEPEITSFMTQYNVTDLNTDNGKLKCQERKTKKGLNKNNIRENLSKYLIGTRLKILFFDAYLDYSIGASNTINAGFGITFN